MACFVGQTVAFEAKTSSLAGKTGCLARPRNSLALPENSLARRRNSSARPRNSLARPRNWLAHPWKSSARSRNCLGRPRNCLARPRNSSDDPGNWLNEPENCRLAECGWTWAVPANEEPGKDGEHSFSLAAKGEALAKCLSTGLGKSRSLRRRSFVSSTKARDKCASKVALLLRKRSPRPSLPTPAPKGVNAAACRPLSSSRGARGRRCFAVSVTSRDSFQPPIAKCRMLSGILVARFPQLRLKQHHEEAHTVLFPHFCRL